MHRYLLRDPRWDPGSQLLNIASQPYLFTEKNLLLSCQPRVT